MTHWTLDTLLWTSVLILAVLLLRAPVRRFAGARAAYLLWLLPLARLLTPPVHVEIERQPMDPALLAAVIDVAPAAAPFPWQTVAFLGWGAGVVAMLGWQWLAYRRERRAILGDASALGAGGRIRLVRSPHVAGPVAFGILRPVIALPHDFDRRFDPVERRAAIAHEVAHHRSGDMIANLIAFVCLSLMWFNPLAWVAHRAFRFDQEAACDARVLDEFEDRVAYGRAIAKAASPRAFLFAHMADAPTTLKRRLREMKNNKSRTLAGLTGLGIVAAGAAVLPATASTVTSYADPAKVTVYLSEDTPEARAAAIEAMEMSGQDMDSVTVEYRPSSELMGRDGLTAELADAGDVRVRRIVKTEDGGTETVEQWLSDLSPEEQAKIRNATDQKVRIEIRKDLDKMSPAEREEELKNLPPEARKKIEAAIIAMEQAIDEGRDAQSRLTVTQRQLAAAAKEGSPEHAELVAAMENVVQASQILDEAGLRAKSFRVALAEPADADGKIKVGSKVNVELGELTEEDIRRLSAE